MMTRGPINLDFTAVTNESDVLTPVAVRAEGVERRLLICNEAEEGEGESRKYKREVSPGRSNLSRNNVQHRAAI